MILNFAQISNKVHLKLNDRKLAAQVGVNERLSSEAGRNKPRAVTTNRAGQNVRGLLDP